MVEEAEYLINHLFLPPSLPQEDDWEFGRSGIIVSHVAASANEFYEFCQTSNAGPSVCSNWNMLFKMIEKMADVQNNADKAILQTAVQNMEEGDVICLHIEKQNSGVILRKSEEEILLEFFQASPAVEAVNETEGKLVMQFPSQPRLSFPHNPHCIRPLCAYLMDITRTEMTDAVPETRKARQQHKEYRDVADIRYISHLLGSIGRVLTSDAEMVAATTVYVTKRINDHALWTGAEKPWRRDPQWLVLRVALQTTLSEMKMDERYGYKAFVTFVLAKALEKAHDAGVTHDRMFVANAKIAGRMMKLSSIVDRLFPFDYIIQQSHDCSTSLDSRWSAIQKRENEPLSLTTPSEEEIMTAKQFQLPQSRLYLSDVYNRGGYLERLSGQFSPSEFESSLPWSSRPVKSSPPADIPNGLSRSDLWLALIDVEHWLAERLPTWLEDTPPNDRLEPLRSFIIRFSDILSSNSLDNPELFSRAFLMLLELWIALDKTVMKLIPMLKEYSSELSVSSFKPLLLPTLSQMKRLQEVERYIQKRNVRALYSRHSLFKFASHADSFPARYFRQNSELQDLRDKIMTQATEKKTKKEQELAELTALYDDLIKMSRQLAHTNNSWTDHWGFAQSAHYRSNCKKCQKEDEAGRLSITIFEWPLPEDTVLSELVVFELRVPQPFAIWRDITYHLARNFSLSKCSGEPSPSPILSQYAFLREEFASPYSAPRLTIGSKGAKSFLVSHYRALEFPRPLSEAIKKHPLIYDLYDQGLNEWVSTEFPLVTIRDRCSPAMPPGPYEKIAWALVNTTHTPNQVIASQSTCPPDITYHEWDSYGHLRSGIRLQPRNIMRELANGTLSFKDPAVYLLFRQAAWQVESRSEEVYRESHIDFANASFGQESLDILENRLNTISDNWQEGWTATSLSVLASRILELGSDPQVVSRASRFLVYLRSIVWRWIGNVLPLLRDKKDQRSATAECELRNRVIQLVVTCRSTYTYESKTGDFNFSDSLAIFIKCSIILQSNLPSSLRELPTHLRHLVESDNLLSVEILPSLRLSLAASRAGIKGDCELDNAIKFAWSGFTRNTVVGWRLIGDRWKACETVANDKTAQIRYIHLNLVDGTLLVDGNTFGSLPKDILSSPLFKEIFPTMFTAAAAPSRMKGMSYELTQHIEGQIEVHFKMIGNDLIIRTLKRETNSVSEFVPATKLRDDFPNFILEQTVIIYHELSKALQFYPLSSGWTPSALPLWTMVFAIDPLALNTQFELIGPISKANKNVLSPHSPLLESLSVIFEPLEASVINLFVTYSDSTLEIQLPRYRLTFNLNGEGNFECEQLPGMFVSRVQSIGTLFGLRNKLILDSGHHYIPRKVIIPDGTISVSSTPNHPTPCPIVTIDTNQNPSLHIKAFVFVVDEMLGRLVGDDTLTSWYLQIYLHVLTSYHLRDPLTQQTGVELALEMLRSSKSFAFMELTTEHMFYLELILKLTPVRTYYPSHTKLMEQVAWHSNLSPLSQSDLFVPLIDDILLHAQNISLFHSQRLTIPKYEGSPSLMKRASFRFSRVISQELYTQLHVITNSSACVSVFDTKYVPACPQLQVERTRTVRTATLIKNWTSIAEFPRNWWEEFRAWGDFSNETDKTVCFDNMQSWLLKPPPTIWFSAYSLCANSKKEENLFDLIFALGVLSYRDDINTEMVHALLAIATCSPIIKADFYKIHLALPHLSDYRHKLFNLSYGHTLSCGDVETNIREHRIPFAASPQGKLERQYRESETDADIRRSKSYNDLLTSQTCELARYIFRQWPHHTIFLPNGGATLHSLLKTVEIQASLDDMFCRRFLNKEFFSYVSALQHTLGKVATCIRNLNIIPYAPRPPALVIPPRAYQPITLYNLIRNTDRTAPKKRTNLLAIDGLIARFSKLNSDVFSSLYADDLEGCADALRGRPLKNGKQMDHISAREFYDALKPLTVAQKMLANAGLWPSMGQGCLLQQISSPLRNGMNPEWKAAFACYAQILCTEQHEGRLSILKQSGRESEYAKELNNLGCEKWDPLEHLDWLLIQLDSNILIRSVQAEIAQKMMFPHSEENTVMQLNMGEGKSSVIVPIISVSLANGSKLVRVVTLKQLCVPMFRLLRQRVTRLANRRLYYMPFNRNAPEGLDSTKVTTILDMFKACAETGGILLCQPEHILSFRLMGLHSLCETNAVDIMERTAALLEAHRWLEMSTRDILDESDEILNIRYQLIYTVGNSAPLQYQPNRWQIAQELLSVLKVLLVETPGDSDGLSVKITKSDQFPLTRIISSKEGERLMNSLANRIVFNEAMPSTPFRSYPKDIRQSAFEFLSSATIPCETYLILKRYCGDSFDQILLLRGLIAHGILLLSLKDKRWRVDYGLDPRRSSLAVPYRAKDSPALRAEFGHPDVIIVLTCLSYYYGGLTDSQLETTFYHLLQTDNPDVLYQSWIKIQENGMPKTLHTLRGLNLDDPDLRHDIIFPVFRFNKAVIDFYLSEYVFPREAKEFPRKLTTNAWDIAREKAHLTTGFSGTNDQSYLLPLSIKQLNSPEQRHTNAQVIEYLLLPENRTVVDTRPGITARELIKQVVEQTPPAMVLLDVGAQILELNNKEVAQFWLACDTRFNVEVAVYCNSADDEFYVLNRKGDVEPLIGSLYNSQLQKALVYLDEARTRGTDFKFPAKTRAVVTLGPKLSKDKLVQACMRMRQLGSTHSVLFFASAEIRRKIEDAIKASKEVLDSDDVITWTMKETCTQITENGGLWATQGLNFDTRDRAWAQYNDRDIEVSDLARILLEKESFTLNELYGYKENTDTFLSTDHNISQRRQDIRNKCTKFGITMSMNNRLSEEQEREIAHEKEDEREIERITGAEPLDHSIDPFLQLFITNGRISSSFKSLADCLDRTTHISDLGRISGKIFQRSHIRATSDFKSTIQLSSYSTMNDFLRPVQWILRSKKQPTGILLISPFEANHFLPEIRASQAVSLHPYSPRSTRHSPLYETFDRLVVPMQLDTPPLPLRRIQELSLFAGQLFFSNHESYKEVLSMLGLYLGEIPDHLKGQVHVSGFVKDKEVRSELGIENCMFGANEEANPTKIFRELTGWRRKGQSFVLTHLGQVLHGRDVEESEFGI